MFFLLACYIKQTDHGCRDSGCFLSEYRELCSSLFLVFKGKKKGKWLNAVPFTGDMFLSEQKGLRSF